MCIRDRDESDPKYARFVPNEEIKITNEYNLNIPRYIDSSEPEDLQDINAHLNGGIPETDVDGMEEYLSLIHISGTYNSIFNIIIA